MQTTSEPAPTAASTTSATPAHDSSTAHPGSGVHHVDPVWAVRRVVEDLYSYRPPAHQPATRQRTTNPPRP